MRALTTKPGTPNSATVEEIPEPDASAGALLVETLAVGICGTDREILSGAYGWAPPNRDRLVLGHESLGRVLDAPPSSGFARGDHVVGIVRRPDPVPCTNCAIGEWDMCRNGRYVERGIKELDGYCAERYRIDPAFAVKLDARLGTIGVLLEPTSVVAKAWEHIDWIASRARWDPWRVLVTGAGPIGLLAALVGVQRGLEVHVFDRVSSGVKPQLVDALGAHYHTGDIREASKDADVIVECTGIADLVFNAMPFTAPGCIACLTGVSSGARKLEVDVGALNRSMVLENCVLFGSVNANRRHYEAAASALARADSAWLAALVTRRVPLDRWSEAMVAQPTDVKVILELDAAR